MLNSLHYCVCSFFQAETRAEFAERTVAKLEKSIDDLEGMRSAPLTCHNTLLFFVFNLTHPTGKDICYCSLMSSISEPH